MHLVRPSVVMLVAALATASPANAGSAPVPRHSSPIQVSADGGFVWVVNPDSDSVGKIAAASNALVAEYAAGDNPRTLALEGDGVYVVNQGSQDLTPKPDPDTVMRLDQASGSRTAMLQLPFGCAPFGVVVGEVGGQTRVFVSCERTQRVLMIDGGLGSVVAAIPLDWPDPRTLALSADHDRLYVAHFLTREPGSTAHVSEIDTTADPPRVARVFDIPADETTCETINSGKGVLNLLMGMHINPARNQLWVGGVNQNNLSKGLFKNDPRFGGQADPAYCQGGRRVGQKCRADRDCPRGRCVASLTAISRNLYKASFHDITRFQIAKIDLTSGAVVGKIDVDEANQGTDLAFSADGTTAYVVDQFFNSLHIFNTARGEGANPTTLFASPSRFGPGGTNPDQPCTGGSFLTASELPFILPPQVQIVPIAADPLLVGGAVAITGNDYDVRTGAMRAVPDGIGTVPHGVAVHPDGDRIYVANFLSRNVTVVKADGFFCPDGAACQSRLDCSGCVPRIVAVVPSIADPDPLPPQLLDGKILFHTAARDASLPNGIGLNAAAPLFNRDDPDELEPVGMVTSTSHDASYVACTSCHPEGGFDGRSWDFAQFGASIRNTMDLRGRPSFAPGVCSDPPGRECVTDSECADNGVGHCANDAAVACELDIQCGQCTPGSPNAGMTCIADRQCGGVCSNDPGIDCQRDGECGGRCREDGVTPCESDEDCRFGCAITNQCLLFACETQPCTAAKCRPANVAAEVPRNVTATGRFFNPMMTVHWNGDRDEVEDFEHTFRQLLGGGDCDGVEDQADKCIGALLMRSNVAKPQEANPDLAEPNRGLSPRLDHMADYVYSLRHFVRNPALPAGGEPPAEAVAGGAIFRSPQVRCTECHDGPSAANQHFTDKRPLPSHPPGLPGGPAENNPFVRHNVGTFNAFDITDPNAVAAAIGQFQNSILPIPGSRGELLDYITPTLVDVWNTAPYNHDGTFASLLHGVMFCDPGLDDCGHPDAGKNVLDLHGTTSNLTPRQLRLLTAFLRAPHNPQPGAVRAASALRLDRAVVRFGPPDRPGSVRFDVRATFTLPPSSSFTVREEAGARVLDEAVTISLADVDEAYVEIPIPAGTLRADAAGARFTLPKGGTGAAPGIRRVLIRRLGATRDYQVTLQGRGMDLTTLDRNHVAVAVEIGEDAFVRTRSFRQRGRGRRSAIKVSEGRR